LVEELTRNGHNCLCYKQLNKRLKSIPMMSLELTLLNIKSGTMFNLYYKILEKKFVSVNIKMDICFTRIFSKDSNTKFSINWQICIQFLNCNTTWISDKIVQILNCSTYAEDNIEHKWFDIWTILSNIRNMIQKLDWFEPL
jgi:hypothetical protein